MCWYFSHVIYKVCIETHDEELAAVPWTHDEELAAVPWTHDEELAAVPWTGGIFAFADDCNIKSLRTQYVTS